MSFLEKLLGGRADDEDGSTGPLTLEKRDMIKGICELSETTVKEVMVPRIDVVFVSADMPIPELLEKVSECGHSRVPVYRDTMDNIIGILYVKDLLRFFIKNEEIEIEKIIRAPYFVPESKRLDSLLREFKRKHVHIAIAVDEYGGVSGIISLEDIIEEIVGEIQDEYDREPEAILPIGDGVYLCDARVDLEDLNERLGTELPDDDFDTLGGFVFGLLGKIPVRYEKASFRNMDFIVQSMDGHKINTVKLVIRPDEEDRED